MLSTQNTAPQEQPEILLVEDNLGDIELTRGMLEISGFTGRLSIATTPEEADDILAYVRGGERHAPDLVLLDLNLPGKHGLTLLSEMKQDPALRNIPVVVLSSSVNPDDIRSAYDARANTYLTKEPDLDRLLELFSAIKTFWFDYAKRPSRVGRC